MQREVNFEEILEDSPMFYSKLKIETEKNKKLKKSLKNMNKMAQQYIKAASNLSEIGKKLSESIIDYNNLIFDSTQNDGHALINEVLFGFANNFKGVNEARKLNFDLMQKNLIDPLVIFINEELRESKSHYKKLLKMRNERNSTFNKFLNTPPNSKNSKRAGVAFNLAEENYVVGCLDLASKLVRIREKKKFEYIDRMRDFLQSQSDFYMFANNVLKKNELIYKKAENQISEVKTYYQDLTNEQEKHKKKIFEMLMEKRKSKEKSRKTLEKSGYLRMKTGGVVHDWSKRFFRIRDNKIWYIKNSKDMKRRGELNLLLCTVKHNYDMKKINCFEIVAPNLESNIILQASTEEEMRSWMEVMSNNIELLLNQQMSDKKTDLSGTEKANKTLKFIYEIPGNTKCADCGASDPDWCAINLGVTFCIDCSGAHRSLGVQFSKVRSLTLDDFEDELIPLFQRLGNDQVNKILEAETLETRKPIYKDSLVIKAQWVIAKYKLRAFTGKKIEKAVLNKYLCQSVTDNDFDQSFKWLMYGANPSWQNPDLSDQTAFHLASQFADPLVFLLLFQFHSKLDSIDCKQNSPLHLAVKRNRIEMVQLLLNKNIPIEIDNNQQGPEDPLSLAKKNGFDECAALIEKHLKGEVIPSPIKLHKSQEKNENSSLSNESKLNEINKSSSKEDLNLQSSNGNDNLNKQKINNNNSTSNINNEMINTASNNNNNESTTIKVTSSMNNNNNNNNNSQKSQLQGSRIQSPRKMTKKQSVGRPLPSIQKPRPIVKKRHTLNIVASFSKKSPPPLPRKRK
ncbi:centaurin/arf [Anaeramoeba flamelloides]|uniref:Centaurin/arf n=1 Tax=Anaeramoeba flamelloides TaxID=1746091 RepID=A0AAV7ZFN2_9EUKA|nr:centaurin/arf [Anaeramoeba flamelloides]